ncbi:UPF0481 protein At3g47200-like [Solanum stenotomum]|uniref:UPF0481 protein At3g47200-like n=1 Tax=Solanum stenotomum TaxID=172797 RepID=UPI0020D0C8BF|nr:UPF0481 protein At3g47200-like [Solanum stenotomum]
MGLRKSNEDAYTPMLISIGPYHKKKPQLGSMEKYKLLYLQRYLRRTHELNVESCISKLEKIKNASVKCYNDNLATDIVEKFSEMLLLDGCFVVEFIREDYKKEAKEDDIIKLKWMKNQVCRDMLLLENQLPFFVLVILYSMTVHPNEENFLYMVRETLLDTFPKAKFIPKSEIQVITEPFDHLLDVVHMLCRPSAKKGEQNMNDSTQNQCCKISFCGNRLQLSKEIPESLDFWQCYHIPTAKELFDSGVSFLKIGSVEEKEEDKTSLFDITFEKGLMKIPCFAIEDTMETFMRNMIAFEQHTSKDIGDDKQVADIFKKLSNGVAMINFYYNEECSKLIQHCEKPWSQMKASLKHNYFQSPWAGASTVAAITLLVLTVIQTVLAFTGCSTCSLSSTLPLKLVTGGTISQSLLMIKEFHTPEIKIILYRRREESSGIYKTKI